MDSKKNIKIIEEEEQNQNTMLKKRVRSEYIRICRLRRLKKAEQAQVRPLSVSNIFFNL